MKKYMLTAVISLLLGATAVSVSAEEKDIMKSIAEANDNETLRKNHDRVAYQSVAYDAEGKSYSTYTYLDKERIVTKDSSGILVSEKDMVYGFDTEAQQAYARLFLDDARKDYEVIVASYAYDPDEKCIETSEENGQLVVHTESPEELTMEFVVGMGFDVKTSVKTLNEYRIDPKTYEIQEYSLVVTIDDKDPVNLVEIKRSENPKPCNVAKKITDAVFSEDSRSVVVTADPGTDIEKNYELLIGKGCRAEIYTSELHPYLYTDEACTEPFEGNESDYTKDEHIFTKLVSVEETEEIKTKTEKPSEENAIVENDEDIIICEICGEPFLEIDYEQHLEEMHGDYYNEWDSDEVLVACEICGNWFADGEEINDHMYYEHSAGGEEDFVDEEEFLEEE